MGVKGDYKDFRYFDTALRLTTVQGFIDLGHLTELWGYEKKTLKSVVKSYISGNQAMLYSLQQGKEIIIYFTEEKSEPRILWYVNDESGPARKWEDILDLKDKKIGVFEELNQLDDEAFALWKKLRD